MRRAWVLQSILIFKTAELNDLRISDAIDFLESKGATAFEVKLALTIWTVNKAISKEYADVKQYLNTLFKWRED